MYGQIIRAWDATRGYVFESGRLVVWIVMAAKGSEDGVRSNSAFPKDLLEAARRSTVGVK